MATILLHSGKVLVAGGAIYATTNKGIWESGTERANQLLFDIKKNILPDVCSYIEKAPTLDSVSAEVLKKWNNGVQNTFSVVSKLPEKKFTYNSPMLTQLKVNITK